MPDQVRELVDRALAAAGPRSWSEARSSLSGGSTRRTAEVAGVSQRTVQRWIAAEEGRSSQSRCPNPARLAQVGRRATLEWIRDGAVVSYSFVGDIEARSGGHCGRRGWVCIQSRDTGGFARMDPEAVREWARVELAGDADVADRS